MITTEQNLREKLAACHHIIHFNGWDDLLATHLSARIPDTDEVLITPHNTAFETVCASNLVKVNLEGKILSNNGKKVMPQAANIHLASYQKNNTIMSIMHTHSPYGTAVASLESGLVYINQHACRFYGDIAYHELDGLALDDEGEHIAASLGDKKILLCRNHGVVCTGTSIEEAMYRQYYLEKVCEMQILTQSAGVPIHPLSDEVIKKIKAQFNKILTPHLEFENLVRRITGLSSVDFRQ